MCKVALIIPALNEASKIASVVRSARNYGDVIVVDDGSSDGTGFYAKAAGAFVATHSCNLGYEAAIETGMQTALKAQYVYAITLDGDGQHSPDLIASFLAELDSGLDLVLGARDVYQRWSEVVFAKFGSLVWGVTDPLCGMKAYRLSWLETIGTFDTKKLVGTELAVKMIVNGAKFSEICITTMPRHGATRFGDGFLANIRIIKALIVLIWVLKK